MPAKRNVFVLLSVLFTVVLIYLFDQNLTEVPAAQGDYPKLSLGGKPQLKTSKIRNYNQEFKEHPSTLSPDVLKGIKTFVFFIGYPRSGHSIVGSILDAHPHVVFSHELKFIDRFSSIFQRDAESDVPSKFFNLIYKRSVLSMKPGSARTKATKGYTLEIQHSWQGRFDKSIEVIGDKSGGDAVFHYLRNRTKVKTQIHELARMLPVNIKSLHVIRNPYDTITTGFLYLMGRRAVGNNGADEFVLQIKNDFKATGKKLQVRNQTMFESRIRKYFEMVKAVSELTAIIGSHRVLDIHYRDLVHNPEETISAMTNFLGISTNSDYIRVCTAKIFKTVSHSRNLIEWPDNFKKLVEDRMRETKYLRGYDFASD